ncbi:AGAP008713-PA [Anopheles gambiae str. PEST]|uniref:AGAP008713-PA n=1 Tax=Anopheles gambiae TaxID=7165 RepID=A0NE44_ANOGA|nr:AGAP008713-PA [Anopheles gambiae str. PEST]
MRTRKLCACFVEGKKFLYQWATTHKESYLIHYQLYQPIMKKRIDRTDYRSYKTRTCATNLAALD